MFHRLHWIGATALLLALAGRAFGAFPMPAELEHSSETQKLRFIESQSARSLRDKTEVGEQRYRQRQAFRQSLIAEMRLAEQQRHNAILPPAATTSGTASGTATRSNPTLLEMALVGVLLLAWLRVRKAVPRPPKLQQG